VADKFDTGEADCKPGLPALLLIKWLEKGGALIWYGMLTFAKRTKMHSSSYVEKDGL